MMNECVLDLGDDERRLDSRGDDDLTVPRGQMAPLPLDMI